MNEAPTSAPDAAGAIVHAAAGFSALGFFPLTTMIAMPVASAATPTGIVTSATPVNSRPLS
jgi:hypothetical protein